MESPLWLTVHLWIRVGEKRRFEAYEREAASRMARYGGEIVRTLRTNSDEANRGEPFEIHLVRFPDAAAYTHYGEDPGTRSMLQERDAAIARTVIYEKKPVPAIHTQRLRLLPACVDHLIAELEGPASFERVLGIPVPAAWPPDLYDEDAVKYTLDRLMKKPDSSGWRLYYVVWEGGEGPLVVGTVGYNGPPDAQGTVEVGYGVLEAFRRRGIATEATLGLLRRAFDHPGVTRAIAETLPELTPSIGVMKKCGFRFIGEGSKKGIIRFELTREAYLESLRA